MSLDQQLNNILSDLQGVAMESFLIIGAIVLLIVGLVRTNVLLLKSLFATILAIAFWLNINNTLEGSVLEDSLFISDQSIYFGSLFLLAGLLILLYQRSEKHAAEFYFFILAMLVGSLFMMKANSLLVIYLSIELVSFSSYILTNFSFKKQGHEASIKYLLFGAICSAIMLFGLGLIYGTASVFTITELDTILSLSLISEVGVFMLLMGLFFKISIVPTHLWVPATYQSAPADATAFISIVPKLGGLILLQRLLSTEAIGWGSWIVEVTLFLGMATIIFGTLGAFNQTNARRMISFGAVAHSGVMLPFSLITSSTSGEAFWWYAVAYALMNVAVFYLLDHYEKKGITNISDYSVSANASWLGVIFTLVLVSLVGLPPLAGFTAKFFLFSTLWEHYLMTDINQILWYLIIAILATVGSLFYYFKIPKQIFLAKAKTNQSIKFSLLAKIIATLFSIGLLLLFFAPKLVIVMQQLLNNVHE